MLGFCGFGVVSCVRLGAQSSLLSPSREPETERDSTKKRVAMVGGITVASGGRGAERIGDLLSLQGRAKRDPEGYEGELLLQLRHFDACLGIFLLQPTTSSSGNAASAAAADPGASKELADMAMFLAHMTPLYPQHLGKFPQQLLQLLASHGATLQPALCRQLTQAVILLRNRKVAVRLPP